MTVATRVFSPAPAILLACGLSGFAPSNAEETRIDWLIVPGERVGPITAGTSEAMLASMFGPENVERVAVYVGEGARRPGTAVYPGDATKRLEILWQDETRKTPVEVRLTGDHSKWQTREGISLGTTLKDIESLNGYPVRMAGFAWDYGGTITDCGRGHLKMLHCSGGDGSARGRSMILRLDPGIDGMKRPEYRQVTGDKDFSSGHPAMQALDPRVRQMIVSLNQVVIKVN